MLYDLDPSLVWLFCPTHPDDEITMCCWIRRLVENGNQVYLSWTHSIAIREQEARATAARLGVPAENLFFHGATDGSACDEIDRLLPKFQAMIEQTRPDRVVCGAFEQGHLDHDTTNYLINRLFHGPVCEVPFYHTYTVRLQTLNRFSDPRGEEVLELEPNEKLLKRQVAHSYPSQNIWSVVLWYEIWQAVRFRRPELVQTERMRLQTHHDFLMPNHPPVLARKVLRSEPWARWVRAMQRAGEG